MDTRDKSLCLWCWSLNLVRKLSCLRKGNLKDRENTVNVYIGPAFPLIHKGVLSLNTLRYEVIIIQEDKLGLSVKQRSHDFSSKLG